MLIQIYRQSMTLFFNVKSYVLKENPFSFTSLSLVAHSNTVCKHMKLYCFGLCRNTQRNFLLNRKIFWFPSLLQ